jgi:uncharacterized protein YcaQ
VVIEVSPAQARRIALAAQGFGRPRVRDVGIRQLAAGVARLGILQLDSVNVFERSHYLPMFSRLGPYNKADLDRLMFGARSRYTEYWAHEASLIPLASWPLWRWKMEEKRRAQEDDAGSWIHSNSEMLDWLRAELADKGPLPASKIEHDANRGRGGWWEWSDVKRGLEYLFSWGEVVSAGRTRFERVYGLTEQVMPTELLDARVDRREAHRQLLLWAARAHGIGTAGDLADYYRLKRTAAIPLLDELVEQGQLVAATVPGWNAGGRARPVYLHPEARVPRRMDAAALLSPFDPVVWDLHTAAEANLRVLHTPGTHRRPPRRPGRSQERPAVPRASGAVGVERGRARHGSGRPHRRSARRRDALAGPRRHRVCGPRGPVRRAGRRGDAGRLEPGR